MAQPQSDSVLKGGACYRLWAKTGNIWKPWLKKSHGTFCFAGNWLAPTINKYCDFNATLTCSYFLCVFCRNCFYLLYTLLDITSSSILSKSIMMAGLDVYISMHYYILTFRQSLCISIPRIHVIWYNIFIYFVKIKKVGETGCRYFHALLHRNSWSVAFATVVWRLYWHYGK